MNTIRRIPEGGMIPLSHRIEQVLATEEIPEGTGTATRRWFTVVMADNRYWLSDEEKLADVQPVIP